MRDEYPLREWLQEIMFATIHARIIIPIRIFKLGLEYLYEYRSILNIHKCKIWKNDCHGDYTKHFTRNNYNIPVYSYLWLQIYLQLNCFLQESGKRHGIIHINDVIIRFHHNTWAAFGCQLTSRWSSALQRTRFL